MRRRRAAQRARGAAHLGRRTRRGRWACAACRRRRASQLPACRRPGLPGLLLRRGRLRASRALRPATSRRGVRRRSGRCGPSRASPAPRRSSPMSWPGDQGRRREPAAAASAPAPRAARCTAQPPRFQRLRPQRQGCQGRAGLQPGFAPRESWAASAARRRARRPPCRAHDPTTRRRGLGGEHVFGSAPLASERAIDRHLTASVEGQRAQRRRCCSSYGSCGSGSGDAAAAAAALHASLHAFLCPGHASSWCARQQYDTVLHLLQRPKCPECASRAPQPASAHVRRRSGARAAAVFSMILCSRSRPS